MKIQKKIMAFVTVIAFLCAINPIKTNAASFNKTVGASGGTVTCELTFPKTGISYSTTSSYAHVTGATFVGQSYNTITLRYSIKLDPNTGSSRTAVVNFKGGTTSYTVTISQTGGYVAPKPAPVVTPTPAPKPAPIATPAEEPITIGLKHQSTAYPNTNTFTSDNSEDYVIIDYDKDSDIQVKLKFEEPRFKY